MKIMNLKRGIMLHLRARFFSQPSESTKKAIFNIVKVSKCTIFMDVKVITLFVSAQNEKSITLFVDRMCILLAIET